MKFVAQCLVLSKLFSLGRGMWYNQIKPWLNWTKEGDGDAAAKKIHMSKKQFRIGDLAEELKVKKFVIRFWEKEFGIESDRSEGGQRFYTSEDLRRLSS